MTCLDTQKTRRHLSWRHVALMTALGAGACDATQFPTRDAAASSDARKDGGAVQITGTANRCPVVAIGASPPDAKVGGHVDVTAGASDPDPGSKLTYAWSAGSGTFVNPMAATTSYNCLAGGPQILTLMVSDGQCTSTGSISVYCFGLPGTGGAPGSGGRGGAAGSGGAGGSGGRGGSGGSGIGSGGSGTGVGSGGATGTGGAAVATCTGDPTKDEGDGCETCTADSCLPETDGCDIYDSDADKQKCRKVYCCLRANNCVAGENDDAAFKCYCGSKSNNTCFSDESKAQRPDGPCVKEVEEAVGSVVPGDVMPSDLKQRIASTKYPAAGAFYLYKCRQAFCSKVSVPSNPLCRL